MSFYDAILELSQQLPSGSTLGAPPKRKACVTVTHESRHAPLSLGAIMAEFRSELPAQRLTLEDAQELRRAYDDHETAQMYLRALFGSEA
jgi:hypothetical protein